jgi:hypothetical protein
MVLVDSHGDAHAMMAFVLLSERSVIGEIKQSFSGFTIKHQKKRK